MYFCSLYNHAGNDKRLILLQLQKYAAHHLSIREAIVNALAHRDYERSGERIIVRVFKNSRLVISSPGGPPDPLKISNLIRGNYDAIWRNPSLADNLNRLGQMEGRGERNRTNEGCHA